MVPRLSWLHDGVPVRPPVVRIARAIAGWVLAFLLTGCAGDASRFTEIARARFLFSGAERPPADSDAWRAIPLPDPWHVSRPGVFGTGWYRLEADVAPGSGDQGFYLTRTFSNAQLWVNGQFAGQLGDFTGRSPDRWATHHLFAMPRALLHDGRNTFDVRVTVPYGKYGGIGAVLVGEHDRLRVKELRDQFERSLAPAVASLTMVLLGGFILVLWVRREEDHLYAYFSLGTILWGLHTGVSLLPAAPLPPPHYEIWWNVVYVLFVALLCIFGVRFAGARWPRFERVSLAAVAASAPILYAASAWNQQTAASHYVRLGGIVMAVTALLAIVRSTLRTRNVSGMILIATASIAAAFGVHDWLGALEASNMQTVELVPYVALFFAMLMGWIMVDRFVKTLNQYERLNVELEERVAEKSRELAVELERQGKARREAENANLAKSRFLAAASHDLRQPLHALGLFAEALDEKTHDPASRALVLRINQAIMSLESLFNEVLDVSKLDAGAVLARPRPIALQPILDRLAADMVPEALRKDLALRVVPTRASAISDPVLLERVLRNLAANAIRYTESGGVVVGVRRRGARLAIEVRDSGIGIPAAEQDRVFDEFYQVENPERDRRKGLGLGLAIVKRLCALLGHGIELVSSPGRGTVFRVVLDRAAGPVEPPADELAPAAPVTMGDACVAVLDDEAEVRDSTAELLRAWGCRVIVAATVEEAIAASASALSPPVLLIVDYRLRGGTNGIDAANALRRTLGRDTPVILVSGESSAEELARIQASGFALLHKPVPPAKLRGLMVHLLATNPP